MKKIFYLFFISIALIEPSVAKDFGVEGHTFEIEEEDMLKVIERQLVKVDTDKLNNEMREKTRGYVERPTEVKGITLAKESRTFYFDPTYTLDHNVTNHEGRVIHKAGTKVNPLEYIPLREALLFIDGDNNKNVEYALQLRKAREEKLKIVLVKGSPIQMQNKHKVWVYFDQGGFITNKLGIKEIPALVEQDNLKLKIKVLGEVNDE